MANKNNNNLTIAVMIIAAIIVLGGISGFGFRSYGMMSGYNSGFMLLNSILNIVIIILIIVGVLWLIRYLNYNHRIRQK